MAPLRSARSAAPGGGPGSGAAAGIGLAGSCWPGSGRQGGTRRVGEHVREPYEAGIRAPATAGGKVQMSAYGLGEWAQDDLPGHPDTPQLGDQRDAHAGGDQGQLGGEIRGFGDRMGDEPGPTARTTIS